MDILMAAVAGLALYLLIVVLFSRVGERHDALRRRVDSIGNKANVPLSVDEELNKPFSERFLKPMIRSLAKKTGAKKSSGDSSKTRQADALKKLLSQAGFTMTAAEYSVVKLFVIGGCAVMFFLMTLALSGSLKNALLGAAGGFFIAYTVMRFLLKSAITKRKTHMERQLPDVLDLLSVSVEAGLGFEQAINHITSNMEGPLIDELTVTYREMSMGRTRRDALTLLGERCDIEEIKNFVGALVQAAQLGISMKNVLRSQSAAMRQSRKAKVQEKAMKISVKMLFPMLIFIFPVIFIILLGPAIVNVIKVFSGMSIF